MKKENIALIGFMGSGKSMVSQYLAKELNREAVSTDDVIESKEACSITEIFKASGEEYFRRLEHEVVAQLVKKDNVIIDCGGGVVLDQKNIDLLTSRCRVFYLKAAPESLFKQISIKSHRPLMQGENILQKVEEMLAERTSQYEQAHHILETDHKSIEEIGDMVKKILNHE